MRPDSILAIALALAGCAPTSDASRPEDVGDVCRDGWARANREVGAKFSEVLETDVKLACFLGARGVQLQSECAIPVDNFDLFPEGRGYSGLRDKTAAVLISATTVGLKAANAVVLYNGANELDTVRCLEDLQDAPDLRARIRASFPALKRQGY